MEVEKVKENMKDVLEKVGEFYYYDLYELDTRESQNNPSKTQMRKTLRSTKEVFNSLHGGTYEIIFNKVENILINNKYSFKPLKNDYLYDLNGKQIYYETYRIFLQIKRYLDAIELLQNKELFNSGFASIENDNRKVITEKNKNKAELVNNKMESTWMSKGEHRLNWFLEEIISKVKVGATKKEKTEDFKQNKLILKFFLFFFIQADLEKFALFYEQDNKIEIEILLNTLSNYLLQKTTEQDIIRSCAILIYFNLKKILRVKPMLAQEITEEIIDCAFNSTVNFDGIKRNIYFKGSLWFLPIFGTTDKKPNILYDEGRVKIVKRRITEELNGFNIDVTLGIEGVTFDMIFNKMINSTHIEFLRKYPREFFRDNPKYSHLPSLNFFS